jgi:tRNA threonylcarbamoyladenosine biosynthesis protein TsaE
MLRTDGSAWLCAQTENAGATQALAGRLAAHLDHGDLLILTGDLGAGKTCFTQGLGVGLGVPGPITSPTFTLVSEHEGRLPLHHLDVYRLDSADDILDLDLPELLEQGVTVVEWGERIEAVLPPDRATVELRFAEVTDDAMLDRRLLRIELTGSTWLARRDALARDLHHWTVPC